MSKNTDDKLRSSKQSALVGSILITILFAAVVSASRHFSEFVGTFELGWVFIGAAVILCFLGTYWQLSGGYWNLRDSMVNSIPGKNWYTRSGIMVLIFILLGLVLGIASTIVLFPIYQAVGQ